MSRANATTVEWRSCVVVLLAAACLLRCASHTAGPSVSTGGSLGLGGSASAGSAGQAPGGTAGSAGATQAGGAASGGNAGTNAAGATANGGAAGAGGAAATGGAAGANTDPCTDRTVCEDFEHLTLGSKPGSPWQAHENNGTITVDGTRAYSGKQSLKVSVAATTSTSTYRQAMLAMTGAPLLPLPNDSLYGRFMIYTDRIPDKTVHWTIAHGDGPFQTGSATYNYGGMGGLMANYYRDTKPSATDCWQSNQQAFPTGAWTCVAFHFDGQKNELQLWLNGSEVTDVHVLGNAKTDQTCTVKGVDGKWYAPAPFKNISVGWESYQDDVAGAHDAWIDDVIFDDQPIACPASP